MEGMECTNTLNDMVLNRCLREVPPGFFYMAGDVIQPLVNPRGLACMAFIFILGFPLAASSRSGLLSKVMSPSAYCCIKVSAIHFLYRASYSLVLDVMLYTVFRQRRPCQCSWNGGDPVQVGSHYGMPSGDSMMGALFGAWIWDASGMKPAWKYSLGITVMFLVMLERMTWGFHSAGQATTGATIGVILYYTSTRLPQLHVLVETAVIIPAGFILLMIDPAREEWAVPGTKLPGGNFNNLLAWYVWGCAMQLMACVLLTRHYMALGIFTRMRQSLTTACRGSVLDVDYDELAKGRCSQGGESSLQTTLMREDLHSISHVQSDYSHMTDPAPHFSEASKGPLHPACIDVNFTWYTGVAMMCLMLLSSAIQHYSVISSMGLCSREVPPTWC